jgi:hypothetical protein
VPSRTALIVLGAAGVIGVLTIAGVAAASPPRQPGPPVISGSGPGFYMYCQDVRRSDGYYCVKVNGPAPAGFRTPAPTVLPTKTVQPSRTQIADVPNLAPMRGAQ